MKHQLLLAACLTLMTATLSGATPAISRTATATTQVQVLGAPTAKLAAPSVKREAALKAAVTRNPKVSSNHWALGDFYAENGRYTEAAAAYDAGLALFPTNEALGEKRSRLFANLGRYSEGIAYFRAIVAADPANLAATREIAFLLLESEQLTAAHDVTKSWVEAAPKSGEAWLQYGKALTALGRFDEAWFALDLAILHGKSNLRAYKAYQQAAIDANQYDATIAYLSRLCENGAPGEVWSYISVLHTLKGDTEAAKLAAAKHAASLGPDPNATAINAIATALERSNDTTAALTELFKARPLGQYPEFIHDRIKDQLIRLGHVQDGIDYFSRLAAKEPSFYVHRILGELCLAANRPIDAAKWFERYLAEKPQAALAYQRLGTAFQQSGADQAALEAFLQAGWYNLGIRDNFYAATQQYLKLGKAAEGVSLFESLRAQMPEKAELSLFLTDLYERQGEFDQAAASLARYQKLRPVSAAKDGSVAGRLASLIHRGKVQLAKGDVEVAAPTLR